MKVAAAIDGIDGLQSTIAGDLPDALFDPVHEIFDLVKQADAFQGIDCVAGTANPVVAVIPISISAERFRQTTARRRDDCTSGRVARQPKQKCRAMYEFAPSAFVGTFAGLPPDCQADAPRWWEVPSHDRVVRSG